MLSDVAKKHLQKLEIAVLIILFLALPLLFLKPSITGYVSSDAQAQTINFVFTDSQALTMDSTNGSIYIGSFLVSGEIIGSGDAAIYLSNSKGKRVLVYKNIQEAQKPSLITGYAVGGPITSGVSADAVEEAAEPLLVIEYGNKLTWPGDMGDSSAGSFTGVCMDSCYLDASDFTDSKFKLEVYIEPGTTLKLQEVFYTLG